MSELLVTTEGSIRYLTLNRPEKRNALNDALISALKDALREADHDDALRAVVIEAAGNDFCSGADLSALQKIAESTYEENLEDARSLMELFTLIRRVRVPVIAAVRGRALAGGAGLATGCDIVLASSTARFGYPEVKIGFVPAMVMAILRRNLPEKLAFEIATRGFDFDAATAERYGLINRVFDDGEFDSAVREYVGVYEKISRSAVEMTKRLLYDMDGLDFEGAITAGTEVNARARMTDDCKKGIERFLNK
jgi:methylglutaconyl-CoA hydratase